MAKSVVSKIISKASFGKNNLLKSKVFGQVNSRSENQVPLCCPKDTDYGHTGPVSSTG